MTNPNRQWTTKNTDDLVGGISAGVVFLLFGLIYIIHLPTNLWDVIIGFFSSFQLVSFGSPPILPLAPTNVSAFTELYVAVFQFSIGITILAVITLILRLVLHSTLDKISENIGNLIYWAGSIYVVSAYLIPATNTTMWFTYWSAIIILIGISLIGRGVVYLISKRTRMAMAY